MSSVLATEKFTVDNSAWRNAASYYSALDEPNWLFALFLLILVIGFLLKAKHNDPHAEKYSMEIKWSDKDHAYIVTVPELPGCRTHGATYEEAVQQGKDAIESWIEASEAWGDPVPLPAIAKEIKNTRSS